MNCVIFELEKRLRMSEEYRCVMCDKLISDERVVFLRSSGYNENEFCCTKHSIIKPIKAIYSGEFGTSELIFCDRVDNDSVRTKLLDSEKVEEVEVDELDEEDPIDKE